MIRHGGTGAYRVVLLGTTMLVALPAYGQSAPPFDMSGEAAAAPFAITDSDLVVYSGTQSAGEDSITRNTGQAVEFRDSSTAGNAGIITNAGGAARFLDASSAGTARLTNNGETAFAGSASAADADIVNNGSGQLTFDGAATAGNARVGNSGFAAFRGNASAANASITNNQSGRIEFSANADAGSNLLANSGTVTFAGASSAGTRFIANNIGGSVAFTDSATAAGADIGNSGTLGFGGQSSLADGTIVNNAGGAVRFSGSASAAGGEIANAGTLDFVDSADAGTAIILTQTGGRTIFSGNASGGLAEMRLDDGAVIDISGLVNGGTSFGSLLGTGQVLLGANRLTVGGNGFDTAVGGLADGGVAGGTGGSLQKVGPGTLRLQGANSYTGATIVSGGVLQAANANAFAPLSAVTVGSGALFDIAGFDQTIGSLAGDGTVDLAADTLTLGGNGTSTDFSGSFTGAGGFDKVGAGTFRLSGDSAIFGASRVSVGTVQVDGALALSPLDVGAGATLAGTGTAGPTRVEPGGAISPGPGIGTLKIAGDLGLSPGAVYRLDNGEGAADAIAATGAAAIDSATLALTQTGLYLPGATATILTAEGGVAGTFGSVVEDYAFLTPVLSYGPGAVTLGLSRNAVAFADTGETFNQRNAGAGLDGAPAINLAQRAVLSGNADNARAAFDQLSGEMHASMRSTLIATSRQLERAMLDRGRAPAALQPGADAAFVSRPAGWARAYAAHGTQDGDGNAAETTRDVSGVMGGVDATVGDTVRLGFAAAYGQGSVDVDRRGSSADVDSLLVGLYGGGGFGNFGLSAGVSYGWHQIDAARSVSFPFFADTLAAEYDASSASAFIEASYMVQAGRLRLEPFAGLSHVMVETERFAESGGDAALTAEKSRDQVTFTTLGLRAGLPISLGYAMLGEVHARAAWNHAFGDTTPQTQLSFLGGLPFTTQGVGLAEDTVSIEAGLRLFLSRQLAFGLTYQGAFGDGESVHGGLVNVAYRF